MFTLFIQDVPILMGGRYSTAKSVNIFKVSNSVKLLVMQEYRGCKCG